MSGLLGSVLNGFGSLLSRRERRGPPEVRVGMSFVRIIAGNVTETAEVSEVLTDVSGIPHIRFTVRVRDQNGLHDEGTRMLSQASFLRTYHRRR